MSDERHRRPGGRSREPDTGSGTARPPVPRSRSGVIGRRFERTGTEPITARSALGVRLILALLFTPLFLAATAGFAVWAAGAGETDAPSRGSLLTLTVICAALALFAATDLFVVLRRRRRERGEG